MTRFAHLAWPGVLVAVVSVAALLLHVAVRGLWLEQVDDFSQAALGCAFVGTVMSCLGTLGRLEQARDEEDPP